MQQDHLPYRSSFRDLRGNDRSRHAQDPAAFLQLVYVNTCHPTIRVPLGPCSPCLIHGRRGFNRLSTPVITVAGQWLVLNLCGLQTQPCTPGYLSWAVN